MAPVFSPTSHKRKAAALRPPASPKARAASSWLGGSHPPYAGPPCMRQGLPFLRTGRPQQSTFPSGFNGHSVPDVHILLTMQCLLFGLTDVNIMHGNVIFFNLLVCIHLFLNPALDAFVHTAVIQIPKPGRTRVSPQMKTVLRTLILYHL